MDALFDSPGMWITLGKLAALIALTCLVLLWIAGVVWALNDARQRSSGTALATLAGVLAGAFFLPGILAYIAIRPRETLADAAEQRLSMDLAAQQMMLAARCPQCSRSVGDDFAYCPFCTMAIQDPCSACSRMMRPEWVMCPSCGQRPQTGVRVEERPNTPRLPELEPAGARPSFTGVPVTNAAPLAGITLTSAQYSGSDALHGS
jgi:RNA polymerase subunit RPABC4/transcription elongation factor Spt4